MAQLFKLQNPDTDCTHIYARDPAHILGLVEYYRKTRLSPADLERPDLHEWVKRVPSLDDIAVVERGDLFYQAGMISLAGDLSDEFFMRLKVLDDFTVHVNPESLVYFDDARQGLLHAKRGDLYKITVPGSVFWSQNFLPEDVARAIATFDLSPWYEFAKTKLDEIARLDHPNTHVGYRRNPSCPDKDDLPF